VDEPGRARAGSGREIRFVYKSRADAAHGGIASDTSAGNAGADNKKIYWFGGKPLEVLGP